MTGAMLTLFTGCQTPPVKVNQPNQPAPAIQSLAGRYTSAISGQSDDKFAEVRITQAGNQYALDFGFGYLYGHGAAPDATGTGSLDANGVLDFQFEDSFSNRGRGVFRVDRGGHTLFIEIERVADSRCLPFYGEIAMKRETDNSN